MRVVEPFAKLLEEENLYKKIEKAGRICYKSEANITDNSYEKFIKNLIKRKHYSVLEHADFSVEVWDSEALEFYIPQNLKSQFVFYRLSETGKTIVHANVRAWKELFDAERFTELTKSYPLFFESNEEIFNNNFSMRIRDKEEDKNLYHPHIKRETFVIQTSRDISHQLVRHRTFSFSQESQRYCNYLLIRFSNNVTFVAPDFVINNEDIERKWKASRRADEKEYFDYLNEGIKPEEARNCLPNATATTLVMTGSIWSWGHFLELRLAKDAQSGIRKLAKSIEEQLLEKYRGTSLENYISK